MHSNKKEAISKQTKPVLQCQGLVGQNPGEVHDWYYPERVGEMAVAAVAEMAVAVDPVEKMVVVVDLVRVVHC